MWLGRAVLYHAGKALDNLRRGWRTSLLTVGTMTAALTVVGLYAMLLHNFDALAQRLGRVGGVTLYLADELEPEAWQASARLLAAYPAVAAARVVTPDDALRRFMALGQEARAMVQGLDARLFPPALELELREPAGDAGALARLERWLRSVPGVVAVDYGHEEHEQLGLVLQALRWLGLVGGLLVGLAVVVVVSNTIKLLVYARRDELEVLQLVGATAGFVRAPFLIEGLLWGLVGGALAALALLALQLGLAAPLSAALAPFVWGFSVTFFAPPVAALVIGAGCLLGLAGSALAVGRFLEP